MRWNLWAGEESEDSGDDSPISGCGGIPLLIWIERDALETQRAKVSHGMFMLEYAGLRCKSKGHVPQLEAGGANFLSKEEHEWFESYIKCIILA